RVEETLPFDAVCHPVQIVVVAVAAAGDRAHHAACETRPQIRRIGDGTIAAEEDASARRAAIGGTERGELVDECRLEPPRTGGEELECAVRLVPVHAGAGVQNGLTTTSTTAATRPSTGISLKTRNQRCECRSVPAASPASSRPQAK